MIQTSQDGEESNFYKFAKLIHFFRRFMWSFQFVITWGRKNP